MVTRIRIVSRKIMSVQGIGLVEVLLALFIAGLISMGVATQFSKIGSLQKSVDEKFKAQDVSAGLASIFATEEQCACNMIHIPEFAADSPPKTISLEKIGFYGPGCTDLNNYVAETGKPLSPGDQSMKVETMKLLFKQRISSNVLLYDYELSLYRAKGFQFKPLSISNISMKTEVTAGNRVKISACSSKGIVDPSQILKAAGQCPSGEHLTGFNDKGELICEAPRLFSEESELKRCPANQYMVGFRASGEPLCDRVAAGARSPAKTPRDDGPKPGDKCMVRWSQYIPGCTDCSCSKAGMCTIPAGTYLQSCKNGTMWCENPNGVVQDDLTCISG